MPKFFSYCPDEGFETHNTAEEAKKAADDSIDSFRDNAEDGWSEEVDQVCWGEVKEQSTMGDKRSKDDAAKEGIFVNSACDFVCDYALQPV